MPNKRSLVWLTLERIDPLIQVEPLILLILMVLFGGISFRIFFSRFSPDRRLFLKGIMTGLSYRALLLVICSLFYFILYDVREMASRWFEFFLPYLGVGLLLLGIDVLVRASKVLLFEYLFLKSQKAGVPVLLVNLFTFLVYAVGIGWLISSILKFEVVPVLATSALFSVVLGLALQDTLGNLFSGLALQIDKPYSIGDWIDIQGQGGHWLGQVTEVSWRATMMVGMAEEVIIVPNRVVAQSQILNFSRTKNPVLRGITVKIDHTSDPKKVEAVLLGCAQKVPGANRQVEPIVLLQELHESWLQFRVVIGVEDFGSHLLVLNHLCRLVHEDLTKAKIALASTKIQIQHEKQAFKQC